MNSAPPVSQHQIAEKLGISQATVSMALAGNPRVALATRERINAIAGQLAYRPDPGLRALGRYRRSIRPESFHATLAWVHNMESPDWWYSSAAFRAIFDAAQKRALNRGYTLDNFWIDRREMSPDRTRQVLRARGIKGLLLLPTFDLAPKIELDWSDFVVVRITDYLQGDPSMHLVGADHYTAVREALARVKALGYRRPGLVTNNEIEHCSHAQYSSVYLGALHANPDARWPAIYYSDTFSPTDFSRWLKNEKPDVLILAYIAQQLRSLHAEIVRSGLRVPEDLGIAMTCLPDPSYRTGLPDFSGVDEGFAQIGERAVELLISLCENFEYGLPEMPIRHLLGGTWHPGSTLRDQSPAPAKKQVPKKTKPRKASRLE